MHNPNVNTQSYLNMCKAKHTSRGEYSRAIRTCRVQTNSVYRFTAMFGILFTDSLDTVLILRVCRRCWRRRWNACSCYV